MNGRTRKVTFGHRRKKMSGEAIAKRNVSRVINQEREDEEEMRGWWAIVNEQDESKEAAMVRELKGDRWFTLNYPHGEQVRWARWMRDRQKKDRGREQLDLRGLKVEDAIRQSGFDGTYEGVVHGEAGVESRRVKVEEEPSEDEAFSA